MGKYSIESYYMHYRMIRCRPRENREEVPGAGISAFHTVRMELADRPVLAENSLLKLRVEQPEGWTLAETEAAIQRLAARYYEGPMAAGISPELALEEHQQFRALEIMAEAFAPKRLVINIRDRELLDYALKHGIAGGVLAEVTGNPYDICEAFAEAGAQQLYRRMPVFVSLPEGCDPKYAAQWHAAALEGCVAPAGYRIALRRLTYPEKLTSGGFAPMRFWWTNRGPACCYEPTEVKLRLTQAGKVIAEIPTGDAPEMIGLADRVYNGILRLPEVPEGRYDLEYGLFLQDGTPVTLASFDRTTDGYYRAGEMVIDREPRPEYEHIWDSFAPDGYYPLEDPAEPG